MEDDNFYLLPPFINRQKGETSSPINRFLVSRSLFPLTHSRYTFPQHLHMFPWQIVHTRYRVQQVALFSKTRLGHSCTLWLVYRTTSWAAYEKPVDHHMQRTLG